MKGSHVLIVAAGGALLVLSARAVFPWAPAGDHHGVRALAQELRRTEALEQRREATLRIYAGKHRAVTEVLAGLLTLRQAAERFGELNALVTEDNTIFDFRVVTGEERLCRSVLFWVRAELRRRLEPATAARLARLEAEYREHFGRDPEPSLLFPPAP
jgi:hypothetical protein